MTSILQSAVREYLASKIGTLPEAIRVEVSPHAGKFDVRIVYSGSCIWRTPQPLDSDSVLDLLELDWRLIEERIHRLAYSCREAW